MKSTIGTILVSLCIAWQLPAQAPTLYFDGPEYKAHGRIDLVSELFTRVDSASSPEVKVSVQQGELVIDYTIDMSNEKKRSQVGVKISQWDLIVGMEIILDSMPVPLRVDHVVGDIGKVTQTDKRSTHRIRVTGLFERFGSMSGDLSIKLTFRYSSINCDQAPRISGIEWAGFTVATAAGVTLVGLSVSKNNEARRLYDEYEMEYLPGPGKDKYDMYEDARSKANLLLLSGIAILAVDAGVLIWRLIDNRNNKDLYERLCEQNSQSIGNFELTPYYEFGSNAVPGPSLGMSLSYRF